MRDLLERNEFWVRSLLDLNSFLLRRLTDKPPSMGRKPGRVVRPPYSFLLIVEAP